MRGDMLKAIGVGDPLTFTEPSTDLPKNAWLKRPHDGGHGTLRVTLENGTLMDIMPHLVRFKRGASSPVGPSPKTRGGPFDCDPCGHGWDEHDDSGCLWMPCLCSLPGERK